MTVNLAKFFNYIRPKINLTTANVNGLDRVVKYGDVRKLQINQFAYILATAWWETGQTMQPVREAFWLSEEWRRKNLRYYPWYGRGLIQITWKSNYVKMGEILDVDFTAAPDLMLEWKYALPALFIGMEDGIYTGKSLDDYIDKIDERDSEDLREYKQARRIVNGQDKAGTIADLALMFEKALKAGGYTI